MLFFGALTPTAAAVMAGTGGVVISLAVGVVIKSIVTEMIKGAIYGAIGAYVLAALGFGTCTIMTAALVGALVGVAVFLPLSFIQGLSGIFPGNQEPEISDELPPITETISMFALRVGIIFVGSLVVSTSVFLGTLPAIAIATGAAITDFAIEAVKDIASFAMS